jgi:hypothetical protein
LSAWLLGVPLSSGQLVNNYLSGTYLIIFFREKQAFLKIYFFAKTKWLVCIGRVRNPAEGAAALSYGFPMLTGSKFSHKNLGM